MLFDGLTAVPLPGHTPFNSGFLLHAEGESLVNLGDAMTDPRLHAAHPEWSPVGDAQPAVAAATRRSVCERALQERLRLFASHFPFPGLGRMMTCDLPENDKRFATTRRELRFKPER